jgi:hypothetical protein
MIEENLNQQDIIQKVKEFQDNYYSVNKKNFFFKKKQKLDFASNVCDTFSLEDLINKTIYSIPDTNIVFIDYTIFKLFANPNIYSQIIDFIVSCFQEKINSHNSFELHINLDTFTITSLERHKNIVNVFIDTCLKNNTTYTTYLNKINIYNASKNFDTIIKTLKPIIEKEVYHKIILLDEDNSKKNLAYFYNVRDNNQNN